MLTITVVSGNIFHDKRYESLVAENYECLRMRRTDLEKSRMRRKTDKGTDVGLALGAGKVLCHGDVLLGNKKTILVEQLPEKVVSIKLKNNRIDHMILVGHIIGNRHKPFSMKGNVVSFPVQEYSELEVFERLFSDIINDVELSAGEAVFIPHAGADIHDHG